MTINKKKLNLKFGAEIKEFIAEPVSDKFKSTDGDVYSFDSYKANSKITKLMTKGFQYVQSINENTKAKKKTNSSINFAINRFLKWIDEIEYKGKLSRNLLLDYQKYLTTNYSSWSTYSLYTVIARVCGVLIEKKDVEQFLIPKNIPLEQAKNSSKAGTTIASKILSDSIDSNVDDINEKVLRLIIDAAWEETFKLFEILEIGRTITNKENKTLIPYDEQMTREEALNGIVNNIHLEFCGISDEYSFVTRFNGYKNQEFVNIMNQYCKNSRLKKWNITNEDINKYFNPSKALIDLILILLSAAQINPESAANLELDCLENDIDDNTMRLSWIKHRGGGIQQSIPFPKGKNKKSKTIPNIISLFRDYSSSIRITAPEELKRQLFICKNYNFSSSGIIHSSFKGDNKTLKSTLNLIVKNLSDKDDTTQECELAIKSCDELNLSLIRNTAINISSKRLNRDISNVAAMDGRKTESSLTEHYLNNNSTREAFDVQIRESQNLMVEWATSKPIVLSNKTVDVMKELDVTEDLAKQIINDEFNNGYGAALIHEHVIIIDTPLNALRMIQWLDRLEESESRMLIDNPDRWFSVYMPQKKLFNEALSLISKKNKLEAMQMNKEFTLPFPEVL